MVQELLLNSHAAGAGEAHSGADCAGGDKMEEICFKAVWNEAGEGIITDMRAVRKDYFLDHDHSAYVDQWD